jgi:hypothetical protein
MIGEQVIAEVDYIDGYPATDLAVPNKIREQLTNGIQRYNSLTSRIRPWRLVDMHPFQFMWGVNAAADKNHQNSPEIFLVDIEPVFGLRQGTAFDI